VAVPSVRGRGAAVGGVLGSGSDVTGQTVTGSAT
jgi:hypothetical protein